MKMRKLATIAAIPVAALALAACGSSSSDSNATDTPSASASASNSVQKIAFFGFWKSNSFTQAVLQGIEAEASKSGIEVEDLSTPTYDAAGQIKAVQDQTVKGDAQMYILLASDSVGMATAAKEAIAAGITVVAAYTPLGPDFSTLKPQVPGLVVVGETPVANGVVLAELAAAACGSKNPCNVAYLEGFKALPLDNARTKSFVDTLKAKNPNAKIVAQVEGGYSADAGKKAAQDALQAAPSIDVMVGSSQAILGAQTVIDTKKVQLIGNGSSKEAFAAVNDGKWYALYNGDIVGIGSKSVELGLQQASGTLTTPYFDSQTMRDPHGTKDVLAPYTGAYSDLS